MLSHSSPGRVYRWAGVAVFIAGFGCSDDSPSPGSEANECPGEPPCDEVNRQGDLQASNMDGTSTKGPQHLGGSPFVGAAGGGPTRTDATGNGATGIGGGATGGMGGADEGGEKGPLSLSDDFNACLLGDPWAVTNPFGVAEFSVAPREAGDAALRIILPSGITHDPYSSGPDDSWSNPAPRVTRVIADDDFVLEAKFDTPVDTSGSGHGLVVELEGGNIIRYDVSGLGEGGVVSFAGILGKSGVLNSHTEVLGALPSPIFLRVERTGEVVSFSRRTEGGQYVLQTSFERTLTPLSVGVQVMNAHGSDHDALIDEFRFNQDPLKNPDGVVLDCL